jgi:hypothetical protein
LLAPGGPRRSTDWEPLDLVDGFAGGSNGLVDAELIRTAEREQDHAPSFGVHMNQSREGLAATVRCVEPRRERREHQKAMALRLGHSDASARTIARKAQGAPP